MALITLGTHREKKGVKQVNRETMFNNGDVRLPLGYSVTIPGNPKTRDTVGVTPNVFENAHSRNSLLRTHNLAKNTNIHTVYIQYTHSMSNSGYATKTMETIIAFQLFWIPYLPRHLVIVFFQKRATFIVARV